MPPNPQNLRKPWKKGESGNPKGRPPKGQAFADLLAVIEKNPGSREKIAAMWLTKILMGDFQFFREYLERMDGKTPNAEPVIDIAEDLDTDILIRIPPKPKALEKPKKNAKP